MYINTIFILVQTENVTIQVFLNMYDNEIDNMRCVYEHLMWGLVMCYDTYVYCLLLCYFLLKKLNYTIIILSVLLTYSVQ